MNEEKKKGRRLFDEMVSDETRAHLKTARQEVRQSYESLFPPGFLEHRRAARREFLLAVRSMIDAALDRVAPVEKKA